MPERRVWVADGSGRPRSPIRDRRILRAAIAGLPGRPQPRARRLRRFDLLDDRVRFLAGPAATATLPRRADRAARAAAHRATASAPRCAPCSTRCTTSVAVGGFVIVDDHARPACRKERRGVPRRRTASPTPLERIDASAVAWRKDASDGTRRARRRLRASARIERRSPPPRAGRRGRPDGRRRLLQHAPRGRAHAALAVARVPGGLDDSTTRSSWSRTGPITTSELGAEFVESFGPEFRYVDLGARRHAVTRRTRSTGASRPARGRALRADDRRRARPHARVCCASGSPDCDTYAPAIVATQQWYVGPGQQGDAMDDGYDQAYEDRLFDGDRVAARRLPAVRDRPLRRRPRLVRRRVGEQLHVRAARAARAGRRLRRELLDGRAAATPTSSSTSASARRPTSPSRPSSARARSTRCTAAPRRTSPTPTERRVARVRLQRALRRPARPAVPGPGQADPLRRPHRLARGAAHQAAPHARPRCSRKARWRPSATACPQTPTPVPDELGAAFIEAVWRSLPWTADDLARPAHRRARPPTCSRTRRSSPTVRPDWIVETGTGDGGRALFLASICELVGHGEVVVDRRGARRRSARCTRACATSTGWPHDEATRRAQVRELVGDAPARSSCSASCADRVKTTRRVRGVRAARAGRLVRRRHRHDRERPPGVAGVRPRTGRGGEADPERARRVRADPDDGEVLADLQSREAS